MSRPGAAALLALVAGTLFFFDLGAYPLLDPDEGRHAAVAREMAAGEGMRRLFLPTLGLEPYREKPAGFYWLVAIAYGLLGVGETSARVVSALGALVVVLAVYRWALARHGVPAALGAALVLATSAGWFGLARFVNLDMTLAACVVIGVLSGLAWLERPTDRPPVGPWVAAGLATLVKGPIGVALVVLPLGLAWLARSERPGLGDLGLVRGVAIMASMAMLLYVPMWLLDPSYLHHFVGTNLVRFGSESPHAEPVWYYLLWIPVLFLPWTLLAPPALAAAARDPGMRPLVLWAVSVPALLTIPSGKLATYALSALVPLSLIVGPGLVRLVRAAPTPGEERWLRGVGWLGVGLLGLAAVGAIALGLFVPVSGIGRTTLAVTALAGGLTLAAVLRRAQPHLVPAVVLAVMLALYPLLVHFVAPPIAELQSDRGAALRIDDIRPAPVIAFAAQAPSMVFYRGTPVIVTEDLALARELFASDDPVFLVTGHNHWERVERALGPRAHRWHETGRRRLYGNVPPERLEHRRAR